MRQLTNDTEEAHAHAFRPVIINPADPDGERQIASLREDPRVIVHDEILGQLAELAESRQPSQVPRTKEAVGELIAMLLGGEKAERVGVWVYFPWSRRLVHLLAEPEFRELRTDRNRYKILPEEQHRLSRCRIGIAGLSVGLMAAMTLALEGVGGSFVLADFDTLGLSNLNRLNASVADLGVNKAVLAARRMFELNPFLDIRICPEGVTDDCLDAFLVPGVKLDLLVEECDDLYMKVRLRERARDFGIPVIMDTSERGMLDIERFDLEPNRPVFHGLIENVRAESLRGLPTREKVPFVLRTMDAENMTIAMAASLVEVKQSITTWPQLASSVTLGGALVTDTARRILLGELQSSGRFFVDLGALIRDDTGKHRTPESPRPPPPAPPKPDLPGSMPIGMSDQIQREEVRWIVHNATLAPSGGNAQPWRFEWKARELRCLLHVSETFLDFRQTGSLVAMGAAIENIHVAARALGFQITCELFPSNDRSLVAVVRFGLRARPEVDDLFPVMTHRCTNRRTGTKPLQEEHRRRLMQVALEGGAELQVTSSREHLETLGRILGKGDRFRILSSKLHAELMSEVRWDRFESAAKRDGLEMSTLELPAADEAAMKIVARTDVVDRVREIGGGRALEESAQRALIGSSAAALLTVPTNDSTAFVQAGRVFQRVWLTATTLGLSVHPYTALLYLIARAKQEPQSLSPSELKELSDLSNDLSSVFPVQPGAGEIILFRLTYAEPPTARALRRHLGDVLAMDA